MVPMTPLPTLPPADNGDDYPPLSALNDILFCPRRCFLHRVEVVWIENVHTTSGTIEHRRVHEAHDADHAAVRIARGLLLVSHRLRLCGVADVVEFRSIPGAEGAPVNPTDPLGPTEGNAAGMSLVPFPIEYKRGKRRRWNNDDVQLCAQAICLEEMLGTVVPAGAVFHVQSKRRRDVLFSPTLRRQTEAAASQLHVLLAARKAPPPLLHPKCRECSVHDLCMPDLLADPTEYQRAAASLFSVPARS